MGDKNRGGTQQHGICGNMMTEHSVKLGGKIWVSTTNGTCSYQCIFCDCTFLSAKSFELHVPNEHNDDERRRPVPPPPPPVPSPQYQVARLNMRRESRFEAEKSHAAPNVGSQSTTGYRKSSDYYYGATGHRRMSIDVSKGRANVDENRRRVSFDMNRHQEVRGKTNVPPPSDAQHRHRHAKDEPEESICTRCTARFKTFELLRDHIRRRHFYHCTHCMDKDGNTPKAFETEKGLWSHQRTHHPKYYPCQCDICPRAFASRQLRKDHMETVHVRGKDVKCDFCSRILMSTFQKKNHIKRAHADRRYHCQLCK